MKEFVKYCIISGLFFVLSLGVYYLFSDLVGVSATIITFIWFPFCFLLRFIINKKWVFKKGWFRQGERPNPSCRGLPIKRGLRTRIL